MSGGDGCVKLRTANVDATLRLGGELARELRPGDVLALVGTLGSGKTYLTKGIAAGLGAARQDVKSPSFVLLNIYEGGRLTLYHFDAYRLRTAQDMFALGCEEIFASGGVSVVEWADRVPECLPEERVEIRIDIVGGTEREFSITSPDDRFRELARSFG